MKNSIYILLFYFCFSQDPKWNFSADNKIEQIDVGSWEVIHKGTNDIILAVGSMVGMVIEGKEKIYKSLGYLPTIVNARFIKPLDIDLIQKLIKI